MPSVTCKIRSQKSPSKWVEIDIGVDGSGAAYWRLITRSPVSFHRFTATTGIWFPVLHYGTDPKGPYAEVPSVLVSGGDDDPMGGFVLFRPGDHFYRLGCGQVIRGEGSREAEADLAYRMDFPCV
jgi:hypothetical protein